MASSESESGEIGHKDDEQVLEPQASKRKYKIKGAKTGQNLAENAVIRGGKTTQLKRPPLRKPGIFAFKNMIIFMLILAAAIYAVQFYLHNFTDPDIDISEMVPSRYNGVVTVNVHQLVHDKETRAYLEEHLSPGGTASKKLELWNSQLDKNGLGLGDITRIYYFFECEKINTEQAKKPDFFCVITSRNPINLNGFMEFLRTQLGAKDSLQQAKVNDRQYYELKWGGQKLEFKLGASNVLLLATDKALLESISNPSRITTASTLYQKTEGLKKEGLVWAAFSDEVDIPNLNNYTLEKGIILIDHKENLTFESNVTFKKANQAETFAKFIKSKYTKDKFDEVGLKQEDIQLDQKGKDLKCQFDIPGKTFGSYIEKYLDAVFKKEEKKKK